MTGFNENLIAGHPIWDENTLHQAFVLTADQWDEVAVPATAYAANFTCSTPGANDLHLSPLGGSTEAGQGYEVTRGKPHLLAFGAGRTLFGRPETAAAAATLQATWYRSMPDFHSALINAYPIWDENTSHTEVTLAADSYTAIPIPVGAYAVDFSCANAAGPGNSDVFLVNDNALAAGMGFELGRSTVTRMAIGPGAVFFGQPENAAETKDLRMTWYVA